MFIRMHSQLEKKGFLLCFKVLLLIYSKEYVVTLADPRGQKGPEPPLAAGLSPRVGTWVWSPWYAKIWWSCIVLYWCGRAASLYYERLDDLYTSTPAAYLNLIFMPMTPFLLLGIGFVWAWMDHHGLEFGPPDADYRPPKRSVGGWLDPMSDPLDPRSPKYWQRRRNH